MNINFPKGCLTKKEKKVLLDKIRKHLQELINEGNVVLYTYDRKYGK